MITKTFVHQLHSIILETDTNDLIGWADSEENNGKFFLKPYDEKFVELVLKRHFKHSNVSSFVRQLHMYGFHKIPQNSNNNKNKTGTTDKNVSNKKIQKSDVVWYFVHPSRYFSRNANEELLSKIQRKTAGFGKDGRRRNILSPVCVSYFDPNGKPLYSQHFNLFQHNLHLPNHFGNHSEVHMANQLNMISEGQRRSISCINVPGNQGGIPGLRTYSQPLFQISPKPVTSGLSSTQNSNPCLSQFSTDRDRVYYNKNNNFGISTTPSMSLPYNNNKVQFQIQSQHNLPLPTAYNATLPSYGISLPQVATPTTTPPPLRMFKPSFSNGISHIPTNTYDRIGGQSSNPYSVARGNTQLEQKPTISSQIYSKGAGSNVALTVANPLNGNVPQFSPEPVLPKLKDNEIVSQVWTQPRVLLFSANDKKTLVKDGSVATTLSGPMIALEKQSHIPTEPVQKFSNNSDNNDSNKKETNIDETIRADLSARLQILVESLVSITNTLDTIRSPDSLTSAKLKITTDDPRKITIELDNLLNMLSELKMKLVDNNDIISKALISINQTNSVEIVKN